MFDREFSDYESGIEAVTEDDKFFILAFTILDDVIVGAYTWSRDAGISADDYRVVRRCDSAALKFSIASSGVAPLVRL